MAEGICGSTLIGPQTVLSAAHCFDNRFFPYVGKSLFINAARMEQGIERIITEVVIHPNYKQGTDLNYDFVLLRLNTPVTVPNPPNLVLNTDAAFPSSLATATAIGHGTLETGGDLSIETLFVDVTIRSASTCSNVYGSKGFVSETMLCAEDSANIGICQGDSGGPLVVQDGNDHILIGVSSFTGPTCGQFPDGYARVSAAVPWIQRIACPWEAQNSASFCEGVDLPPTPAPTNAPPTRSPQPTTTKSGDTCGEAISLGTISSEYTDTLTGTTVGASTEPFLSPCNVGDAPAVWYTFEPSTNMEVTVSLCNSSYDTKLAILRGSSCSELFCLFDNDDSENQCGEALSLQSHIAFEASAGNTYYIIVSGFQSDAGDYELSISTTGGVPLNNVCSLATELGTISSGAAGQATGTTKYADSEPGLQTCGIEPDAAAVWNTFEVDNDSWVTVSLCGSDPAFDTTLLILSSPSDCSSLQCVAGNDDSCGLQSSLKFFASAGVTYHAVVSGYDVTSFGEYEITVTKATDDMGTCVDAIDLGTVGENISRKVNGNTALAAATIKAGCEIDDIPSIFYTFTAIDTFEAEVSLCGSNYDTSISVFYGSECGNLQCLGNNDDSSACSSSLGSQMSFMTEPNVRYYIAVSGSKLADPGMDTGDYELSLSKSSGVRPTTTGCEEAIDFGLFDFETTFLKGSGSTVFANTMPSNFGCGLLRVRSRWYSFQVETMAEITASLCNSDFDTWMSVLVGDGCSGLGCVGHNDNGCGINSVMSFLAIPGQTYFVVVSGYSSRDVGEYELRVDGEAVTQSPTVSPAPTVSEAPTSERVPTSNPPPSGPSAGKMAVPHTLHLLSAIMGVFFFFL